MLKELKMHGFGLTDFSLIIWGWCTLIESKALIFWILNFMNWKLSQAVMLLADQMQRLSTIYF